MYLDIHLYEKEQGFREKEVEGRKRRDPIDLFTPGLRPCRNVHQQIFRVAPFVIHLFMYSPPALHSISIGSPNLGMLFLEEHKVLEMSFGFHTYSNKSQ